MELNGNGSTTAGKQKSMKSNKRGRKKKNTVVKVKEDDGSESETNGHQFNPHYLFDYLVSPLKSDYEFGRHFWWWWWWGISL